MLAMNLGQEQRISACVNTSASFGTLCHGSFEIDTAKSNNKMALITRSSYTYSNGVLFVSILHILLNG